MEGKKRKRARYDPKLNNAKKLIAVHYNRFIGEITKEFVVGRLKEKAPTLDVSGKKCPELTFYLASLLPPKSDHSVPFGTPLHQLPPLFSTPNGSQSIGNVTQTINPSLVSQEPSTTYHKPFNQFVQTTNFQPPTVPITSVAPEAVSDTFLPFLGESYNNGFSATPINKQLSPPSSNCNHIYEGKELECLCTYKHMLLSI
eukprot:TRINITY_DN3340_c0_g1_i1.p1 TRINITY_DN3340_c0_g1~~TRINITY_DN3340_c0_g1_i1.p1  ORF type:complete len:200 (+),score=15.47 TRINITY_DN3340_c0_g1_i1:19-618(+)